MSLTALIPIVDAADAAAPSLPMSVIVHPSPEVRDALGAALDRLGAPWRAFEPDDFGPASIDRAKVVFADGRALDDLVVLGPLLDARLVEIVEEGLEPTFFDVQPLHMPADVAQLEELLRNG